MTTSIIWTPEHQRQQNEAERIARLCVDGTDNHERVRASDLVLDSAPPKFDWMCPRCGKRGTQKFGGDLGEAPPFDPKRYDQVRLRFETATGQRLDGVVPDPPMLVHPDIYAALTAGRALPPEPTEFYEGEFFDGASIPSNPNHPLDPDHVPPEDLTLPNEDGIIARVGYGPRHPRSPKD